VYSPGGWTARGITTDQVAKALEAFVDGAVVNHTGLGGPFNVHLEFTRETGALPPLEGNPDRASEARTSIFTALREQLGLELEAQKDRVSILVIDHAEKPSGN